MKLRKSAKRQARKALRGHQWEGAALFLLWGMMWSLVSLADRGVYRLAGCPTDSPLTPEAALLTLITVVFRVILLAPLGAGAAAWFAALAGGWTRPINTIFWAYGNRVWLRSLGVKLVTGLLTWTVTLAPLAGMGFSLWLLREKLAALPPKDQALTAAAAGVAALLWLLISRAYYQRFAMALFLLGPDYGYTASEAIALSVEYTRGHRWRLVWMDLSFLPWFAACLLVIPALYVLPYYAASRARYFSVLVHRARAQERARRSSPRRRTLPRTARLDVGEGSQRMPGVLTP